MALHLARATAVLACAVALGPTAVAAPPRFPCRAQQQEQFADRAQRYLFTSLAFSPVLATQMGYHEHNGTSLDDQLDDFSPQAIADKRQFLLHAQRCFAMQPKLSPQDAADLALVRNDIALSLLQLDEVQAYKYRPDSYVELIGSGLFFPLTQTNGTEESRLGNAVARMQQVPRLLAQAREQLVATDAVFIDTAVEENQGNREVVEQIGGMIHAASSLRPLYEAAAQSALSAIDEFSAWLKTDLAKRDNPRDWRTGAKLYAKLFPLVMGTGNKQTPASVLRDAERDIQAIQEQMFKLALPLHQQWFSNHGEDAELPRVTQRNRIITEVLNHIGDDHAQPQDLLATIKTQAADIRAFISQHDLLTLSGRDNLKIIDTPPFMRGVYKVAGFYQAPPLDPASDAQYWVTPIDPAAPREQSDSKLREYNNWMLRYLTIHEALPGHYTQFEHANNIQPAARRLLRVLLGNGPYIEGWGEYAVKEMMDAGYANSDPRFQLMVLKIRLRVAANAILDIRMHTMNMSDAEALYLMQHEAFQTKAEADGKLIRAKLTVAQLPTYYVGYKQWDALRKRYEYAQGTAFSLRSFNDAALDEGPLPISILEPLLLDGKHRYQHP